MGLSNAVYRHVLEHELKHKGSRFTENNVAKELKISPNTVSIAVRKLEAVGAIALGRMHFEVRNFEKALYYWAAARRLDKDIAYKTYVTKSVGELEKEMPDKVAYTCYTGYTNLFGNDAADYSEVYVYAAEAGLQELIRRFPKRRFSATSGYANLVAIKPDKVLNEEIENNELYRSTVPMTQLYVDLWNLKEWYAHDFEEKLRTRLVEIHGKKLL